MNVAVFAASSSKVDDEYFRAASLLGRLFAEAGITAIFGGGGIGLMGSLADTMLASNGKIIGVIPRFMVDEGWGHLGIANMIVTNTMSERKKQNFRTRRRRGCNARGNRNTRRTDRSYNP